MMVSSQSIGVVTRRIPSPQALASASSSIRRRPTRICQHLSSLTFQLRSFSISPNLYAHHAEQGRANGPKNGPGKRLGCKKSGGELVVPGNIIFRQRGTRWFPGENVGIGRDHTIFALAKGFVRYYRDPFKNPNRKYIGVALKQEDQLPTPLDAPRRRRLGMEAVPLPIPTPENTLQIQDGTYRGVAPRRAKDGSLLKMGANLMFSTTNWDIGRVAEREGIAAAVRPFDHKDRWLAWRKRTSRRKMLAGKKALEGTKKQKKGKKDKAKGKARALAMSKKS